MLLLCIFGDDITLINWDLETLIIISIQFDKNSIITKVMDLEGDRATMLLRAEISPPTSMKMNKILIHLVPSSDNSLFLLLLPSYQRSFQQIFHRKLFVL